MSEPPDTSADAQARIAELREPSFSASRRGFDRDEVERYLAGLADWLEGQGLDGSNRGELKREIAWVGERTSEILVKAEETANELRERAEVSAAEVIANAEAEATRIRAEAEEEARHAQLAANTRAEEVVSAAERRSETLTSEATEERRDLQILIGDLLERRDEIVADGKRLADELGGLFADPSDEAEAEDDSDCYEDAEEQASSLR